MICVSDGGYRASLVVRRIYRVVPDPDSRKRGLIRIIDESGEDYLFPRHLFEPLDIPQSVIRKLAMAT